MMNLQALAQIADTLPVTGFAIPKRARPNAPASPVPVVAAFAETVTPKKPARVDLAKAIEDMGEWCDDVHDMPASIAIDMT
ncbi:hypothetical protein [Achromobacter sp. AGC39]